MAGDVGQYVGDIILKFIEILSCQCLDIKFSSIYLKGKKNTGRGVGVPKFINLIEIRVARGLILNFKLAEIYSNLIRNVSDNDDKRTGQAPPAESGRIRNSRPWEAGAQMHVPLFPLLPWYPWMPHGSVGRSGIYENEVKE